MEGWTRDDVRTFVTLSSCHSLYYPQPRAPHLLLFHPIMPTTTTDSLVPPTEKPHRSSDITADSATVNSANTTNANASGPPRLHFTFKPKNPLLYLVFLVVCNVLLPCLLYYLLLICEQTRPLRVYPLEAYTRSV